MKQFLMKARGGAVRPARPTPRQLLTGFIGGFLAIGSIAILASFTQQLLLMAPFGATCVLLFAAPDSPLAQPRNVIGGHFISSLIGLLILNFVGNGPLEMALAVGLAIAFMQASGTLHAPAGADPLVVILGGTTSWSFLLFPVLLSSILLVLIALIINNVGRARAWPKYW